MAQPLSVKPVVFLALLYIFLPARAAEAALCPAVQRPVIEVTIEEMPVRFDTGRTRAELGRMPLDTVSPWPARYHTAVGGLTAGRIAMMHKISYRWQTDPASRRGCVWLTGVEVIFRVHTKIHVAADLKGKACRFRAVFAHEAKHVAADRVLLEKKKPFITGGLNLLFAARPDYVSGPVPAGRVDAYISRMDKTVKAALQVLFAGIRDRRAEKHQAIDSLREYKRISSRC